MFVVLFKQHGALSCEQEVFGPFDSYADAEEALCDGSVPALEQHTTYERNGWRYIQHLTWVKGCIL